MSSISKSLLFSTYATTTITKNFDTLLFPSNSIVGTDLSRFDLYGFNGLQSVTIEDNNFPYVNDVQITGIETLLRMSIGKSCFTNNLYNRLLNDNDENSGTFIISDCPQFQSLSIGPQSFTQFTSFNASSNCLLFS